MKKKYNYFSNLKFMLKEHWSFDKSYVIMQIGLTPLGAISSVVAAYLPKIVLDCVENKTPASVDFPTQAIPFLYNLLICHRKPEQSRT